VKNDTVKYKVQDTRAVHTGVFEGITFCVYLKKHKDICTLVEAFDI